MRKLILSLILLFSSVFVVQLLNPLSVSAQFDPLAKPCETKVNSGGADEICNASEDGQTTNPITGDDGIITAVANLLSFVAAIIAVIIIIIAGITMVTSGGDAGKVTSSRNAIIYTVVGLIVIVLARTIVVYIFENLIQGS